MVDVHHGRTCHVPKLHGPHVSGVIEVPDRSVRGWGVFSHGFTLGKDSSGRGPDLQAAGRDGIGMLRFDALGLGGSEGDWGDGSFTVKVDDVVKACEFMADRGTPADILVGHSWGGSAVLAAARQSPGVRSVVTVAAPVDPSHVEKHYDAVVDRVHIRGHRRLDGRRAHADPEAGVRRGRPRGSPARQNQRPAPAAADPALAHRQHRRHRQRQRDLSPGPSPAQLRLARGLRSPAHRARPGSSAGRIIGAWADAYLGGPA